jgi:hypothetical protein
VYPLAALSDQELEIDEDSTPDQFLRLGRLPRKQKIRVTLVAAFVVWHMAVTLIWGAGDNVRSYVRPLVTWYAGGLKLAGTWGMFAAPARMHVVFVYGVTSTHERFLLSPNPKASLYQSLVDMRERKMRSRLGDKEQRDFWGTGYLDSFCRRADGSWFQRIELESAEHDDQHRWGKRSVILTRSCFFARKSADEKGGATPKTAAGTR